MIVKLKYSKSSYEQGYGIYRLDKNQLTVIFQSCNWRDIRLNEINYVKTFDEIKKNIKEKWNIEVSELTDDEKVALL